MVCRGVSETTDIHCHPRLLQKNEEDPEVLGGKKTDRKELEFWPNEDGVKNALCLISTVSTEYCYGEQADKSGRWTLSETPIEYRVSDPQPERISCKPTKSDC